MKLKYGIWNVGSFDPAAAAGLSAVGFSPLTAAVLCSRGYSSPEAARAFLSAEAVLPSPLLLRDMDRAAERVRRALRDGETIAVFGDYDVDGITSTCLLTEFLRSQGADCLCYIPARLEEGYGLNEPAVRSLAAQGVTLIVTVDCGITAEAEALLCRSLGVDLIITDHHECKGSLPEAAAVVDPHRPDDGYPHRELAGVGVAFKLASAILGDQAAVLAEYADLVCLGTVADVMPILGENRAFVSAGLRALAQPRRPGLRALMRECGCDRQTVTASAIGYTLAPRINAAGRMGEVNQAIELFLTGDPDRAAVLAENLCQLNRKRQEVESEIYAQAAEMLRGTPKPSCIVLADERWHQGVVGIVASRLAEEYCCPAFLICLDGDHGKASSRSYGGFSLFGALERLEPLLESYGGHELAAGFTISRANIPAFRTEMTRLVDEYRSTGEFRAALEVDCAVDPSLLTIGNVEALDQLEPCGAGCPRPVFCTDAMKVEQLSEVGGGRHLRLRLSRGGELLNAIFFSNTAVRAGVSLGDTVEAAFTPQVNEFRGVRSVQLNIVDLRPMGAVRARYAHEAELYARYLGGLNLSPDEAGELLPQRPEFIAVWRYLVSHGADGGLFDDCGCMCRKISRSTGVPASLLRTRICLDVFAEQGLISLQQQGQSVRITLTSDGRKVDLDESRILIRLRKFKAGDR